MNSIHWKFLLAAVLLILSMSNRKGKKPIESSTSKQMHEQTQMIVQSASSAEPPNVNTIETPAALGETPTAPDSALAPEIKLPEAFQIHKRL